MEESKIKPLKFGELWKCLLTPNDLDKIMLSLNSSPGLIIKSDQICTSEIFNKKPNPNKCYTDYPEGGEY